MTHLPSPTHIEQPTFSTADRRGCRRGGGLFVTGRPFSPHSCVYGTSEGGGGLWKGATPNRSIQNCSRSTFLLDALRRALAGGTPQLWAQAGPPPFPPPLRATAVAAPAQMEGAPARSPPRVRLCAAAPHAAQPPPPPPPPGPPPSAPRRLRPRGPRGRPARSGEVVCDARAARRRAPVHSRSCPPPRVPPSPPPPCVCSPRWAPRASTRPRLYPLPLALFPPCSTPPPVVPAGPCRSPALPLLPPPLPAPCPPPPYALAPPPSLPSASRPAVTARCRPLRGGVGPRPDGVRCATTIARGPALYRRRCRCHCRCQHPSRRPPRPPLPSPGPACGGWGWRRGRGGRGGGGGDARPFPLDPTPCYCWGGVSGAWVRHPTGSFFSATPSDRAGPLGAWSCALVGLIGGC